MLTIEFEPPEDADPCPCCGGRTTVLTRYVRQAGAAYAVVLARFSDNHPEQAAAATVSLGAWGEGAPPEERVAFAFALRSDNGALAVRLLDAADSPWRGAAVLGPTLDREEARLHPLYGPALEVVNQLIEQDGALRTQLFGA